MKRAVRQQTFNWGRRLARQITSMPGSRQKLGLPKCNWQFWHEPDVTNHGPQITLTRPDGTTYYLIDIETFWAKLR